MNIINIFRSQKYKNLLDSKGLMETFFKKEFPANYVFPDLLPDVTEYQLSELESISNAESNNKDVIKKQLFNMSQAGLGDQGSLISHKSLDLEFFIKLDEHYTQEQVLNLINNTNSNAEGNDVVITVCEIGSLIGDFLQEKGFKWVCFEPYFTSILVHPQTGIMVPPFDIIIKKLSTDGIEYNLKDKIDEILYIVKRVQEKL